MSKPARSAVVVLLLTLLLVWFFRSESGKEPVILERGGTPVSQPEKWQRFKHNNPTAVYPIYQHTGSGVPPAGGVKRDRWTNEAFRLGVLVEQREGGQPMSNARVSLLGPFKPALDTQMTNHRGWAFFQVAPGQYAVQATHPEMLGEQSQVSLISDLNKTIRLSPKIYLEGRVVNQDRRGVAGATVEFIPPHPERRRPYDARTDASGFFRAEVSPGSYRVLARKSPHEDSQEMRVEVDSYRTRRLELVIYEKSDLVELTGRVLDDGGAPVSLARILVSFASGERGGRPGIASQYTDQNGNFSLRLRPAPEVSVSLSRTGYESWSGKLELQQDVRKDFVVRKLASFAVFVYDWKGKLLEEATVIGNTETGRDVVVKDPEANRYYASEYPFRIQAHGLHLGYGFSAQELIHSYRPQIHITLQRGGSLTGLVIGQQGPISEFAISFRRLKPNAHRHQALFNSRDGSFTIRGLQSERFEFTVLADGYEQYQREVEISAGETLFLDILMKIGPPPYGSLRPRSRP